MPKYLPWALLAVSSIILIAVCIGCYMLVRSTHIDMACSGSISINNEANYNPITDDMPQPKSISIDDSHKPPKNKDAHH